MLIAAAWLLLLLAAFSAAMFAWFSSSRYTNVTPVAHTVSDSGYDLLIGASQGGPFDTECALSQTDKTLYPISTADLTSFWRGTFQNANGISGKNHLIFHTASQIRRISFCHLPALCQNLLLISPILPEEFFFFQK